MLVLFYGALASATNLNGIYQIGIFCCLLLNITKTSLRKFKNLRGRLSIRVHNDMCFLDGFCVERAGIF